MKNIASSDKNVFPNILDKEKLELYKSVYSYFLFNPPIDNGAISTVYPISMSKDKNLIKDVAKAIPLKMMQEYNPFIERMIENEQSLKGYAEFVTHKECKQTTNTLYIIYPLMNGGSLENYLILKGRTLSLNEAVPIFYKLAKIIDLLHKENIVHRDINPSHILIQTHEKNSYLLGGFLFSHKISKYGLCREPVGKEGYKAPEVKECTFNKGEYGFSADVFSFGATIFRVLCGEEYNEDTFQDILKVSNLDNITIDLLMKCLDPNPSIRINIKGILEHKLFEANVNLLSKIAYKPEEIIKTDSSKPVEVPSRTTREPYLVNKNFMLGQGGFSKVYLCNYKGNPNLKYAMKIVQTHKITSKTVIEQLKSEIDLMVQLKNLSYVINIIDFFYFKKKLHLILEYCNGDNIQKYIDKHKKIQKYMDFEELKIVAWNIAAALDKMHKLKMIHRDIKPMNILLNMNSQGVLIDAKLCDFGLSKQSIEDRASILGTPAYFAPEMIQILGGSKGTYTNKVDVWSFGVLLFFMGYNMELCSYSPNTKDRVYKQGLIEFPSTPALNPDYIELIKKCLNIDPQKRPTFEQILNLEFFWILNFESPSILPFELVKPYIRKSDHSEIYIETSGKSIIKKIPKTILCQKDVEKHIRREIDILIKMRGCPNLVELQKYLKFEDEIYLVFGYCNGGDIINFLKKNKINSYPIEVVKLVGRKIAEALDFLHSRRVIHRHVNPQNVFLKIEPSTSEICSVCLGDFGFSRMLISNEGEISIILGAKSIYSSPEIREGKLYKEDADIYSFGMLLYFMHYGLTYEEHLTKENLTQNNNKTFYFPKNFPIPIELEDLIIRCIGTPNQRPTAQELLKHDFLIKAPSKFKI